MERNPLIEESPLSQPLKWLTEQSLRAPGVVVGGALLLTLLAVLVTANGLRFKTSRLDLLNPHSSYNQRWLRHIEEFDEREDAVIVVRGQDPVVVATTLEDFAAKLRKQDQLFESIFYKRQLDNIKAKGLHFLSQRDLQRLAVEVTQAAELAEATGGLLDPAAALAKLNDQMERGTLSPKARGQMEEQYGKIAGILRLAMQGKAPQARRESEGAETLPLGDANRLQELEPRYLTAENGGGSVVNTDRKELGPWETFTLVQTAPGVFAFRTEDGHFLSDGIVRGGMGRMNRRPAASQDAQQTQAKQEPSEDHRHPSLKHESEMNSICPFP